MIERGWRLRERGRRPVRRAIVESYKLVCICNKIRKGVIEKAIGAGARSFDDIKRRTRARHRRL
jgi:NAD(P)H-nitrite reductase large subunit